MTYRLRTDQLRAAARAAGDTTATAIAERIGLSQPQMSRLLRHKSRPSYLTLKLMERAYGLAEADLVEEVAA